MLVEPDAAANDPRLDAFERGLARRTEVVRVSSPDHAVEAVSGGSEPGAVSMKPGAVLIKASRIARLERVAAGLLTRLQPGEVRASSTQGALG